MFFLREYPYEIFRADGRVHVNNSKGAHVAFETTECDGASALHVRAVLETDKPIFKEQSGLTRLGCMRIRLPAPQSDGGLLAIYQHKSWWLRPEFLTDTSEIPAKTQLLLWREDGTFHVLLALCSAVYRSDISGDDGGLLVSLGSNTDDLREINAPAAVYAQHHNPYICCESAVIQAARLSGGTARLRKDKLYPELLDYLGFCSWDAFYHDVNAAGLMEKLEEFKSKNLPLKWLLIDDGWSEADTEAQELVGFGAAPEKFQNGLGSFIKTAKEQYGLRGVGVWQAAMGYWNGIRPDSPAARKSGESLMTLGDGRVVPAPVKAFSFWNAWHTELAREGIDFVKIDEQSASALFYRGVYPSGTAAQHIQNGIGASCGLHFSGNAIHCMGMAPEELWHRSSQAVVRSSDDFIPSEPQGFGEHCMQNAYNALLYGTLYWGDWDMFWSDGQNSQRHSMLRAVGGGPVYTSDRIGQTNPETLLPLIDKNGKLLRCDGVGLPSPDCLLGVPEGKPLKIFNTSKGCLMIAAFALSGACAGTISAEDFPTMPEPSPYVWYSSDRRSGVLDISRKGAAVEFTLAADSSLIFLLLPKKKLCTPIGLLNKHLSPALITGVWQERSRVVVTLSEGGLFGFFAEHAPQTVLVNGTPVCCVPCEADSGSGLFTVDCCSCGQPLLVQIEFGIKE